MHVCEEDSNTEEVSQSNDISFQSTNATQNSEKNNIGFSTPISSSPAIATNLEVSSISVRNDRDSFIDSAPPSGFTDKLDSLGSDWPNPDESSKDNNVNSQQDNNLHYVEMDVSTKHVERHPNEDSNNNEINSTDDFKKATCYTSNNVTEDDDVSSTHELKNSTCHTSNNVTEDNNVISGTHEVKNSTCNTLNSVSDATDNTDNDKDLTYDPLNSTKDTSIQIPVKSTAQKKEISPLKQSSFDIRDVEVPDINYINPDTKIKTKQHFCVYCKTLQSKFSRHLMLKHKKETEVRKFIFLPKGHRQRLKIIDAIRKKGDYLHNTVKSYNTGILILPRRRQDNSTNTSEDYTCCKLCKGFFPQQTIRFHVSNCQEDRNKVARDILISGRRVTGYIHALANDKLRNHVFPVLRDDDISRSIRYDELLIKFANKLTEKYTLNHQHDMIRAQLRLLGRLKLEIISHNDKISDFQEIFKPQNFELVIKSLRAVANWDNATMSFKTPAVAQNLVTLITKCCKKFRTECIKIQDEQSKKLAEDFLLLWQEDVPVMINKKAQEDLTNNKRLKKVVLPSKEDIKLLYDYLIKESATCLAILEDEFNFEAWKLLTQCTLISVQIFNPRRAGEIERLKIENYNSKQDLTDHIDKELYNKLSPTTKNVHVKFEYRPQNIHISLYFELYKF